MSLPTVRFAAPNFSNDVSEAAGSLSHMLTLSEASNQPISVTIQGPSYRAGDLDYANKVVTFAPGETTATFSTAVHEDTLYEGNEVFAFQIVDVTGAEIDRSSEDAKSFYGYILDNDAPSLPTVRFDAPNFSNDVSESAGSLSHTLTLSSASSQPVSVTIQGPSYRAGDLDYTNKVVTFAPGQTTATFTTAVYEDAFYEGSEVFAFEIVSATGAEIDRSSDEAKSFYGYVLDNDAPSLPTVRFAAPNFSDDVSEAAGSLSHILILSEASNQPVSVTIEGPSYRAGDLDYTSKVVTFAPGETTATFTTAVHEDTLYEGDEVFAFQIVGVTGAEIDRSSDSAGSFYGYILDNDGPADGQVDHRPIGSSQEDHITGSAGNDQLIGLGGNDDLAGDAGDDYIAGGHGDDSINGGTGADSLNGDEGDDYIVGGEGNDSVFGGAGDDSLNGDDGNDYLVGGSGDDSLFGGAGNDSLNGNDGNDYLVGGTGNDGLFGGAGDDSLNGNDGNDYLVGGAGSDGLFGGHGDDQIIGGTGPDYMVTGDGHDLIIFWPGDGVDAVADFDVLNDRINLAGYHFANFAEVMTHASRSGDNTVLDFGEQGVITLIDVVQASLQADNFNL